jgi:hypothetical protein
MITIERIAATVAKNPGKALPDLMPFHPDIVTSAEMAGYMSRATTAKLIQRVKIKGVFRYFPPGMQTPPADVEGEPPDPRLQAQIPITPRVDARSVIATQRMNALPKVLPPPNTRQDRVAAVVAARARPPIENRGRAAIALEAATNHPGKTARELSELVPALGAAVNASGALHNLCKAGKLKRADEGTGMRYWTPDAFPIKALMDNHKLAVGPEKIASTAIPVDDEKDPAEIMREIRAGDVPAYAERSFNALGFHVAKMAGGKVLIVDLERNALVQIPAAVARRIATLPGTAE